ncbi:heme o synthase [Fictibacillus aquaticus]|uniref:Protoheme IX farnesyltransferase n=1 Tax=Fictibacillus aquaticus TaxID=2021314 RepID=A0A235FDY8_9BACL|nr:heme o synthase [Fictibacillus aquaticus]OYD59432.1 protoheme IX farnesyltransferase [Fictibacillus aquaticus]
MERKLKKQKKPGVLSQTVKTGIIKSNLVPMFAGLTLALYTYNLNPAEKLADVLFVLIGTILVIGAAGTFNNIYDRDIDAIMERTKNRPTVTGEIKVKTALMLAAVMAAAGITALAFTTPLAAVLGFLGLFFYVVPYTMWSKRRTVYNTEIGSISGAMPPLIGWAAMTGTLAHPAVFALFIIQVIWQMPHFYAIAIRRHDEYKAAKIPMLPVEKGIKRTYVQTNVYLVLLCLTSFLFLPLSLGLTLVALLINAGWLVLSIYGYSKKKDSEKWAKLLFIYSLFHMTILFSTVIVYSLVGIFILK